MKQKVILLFLLPFLFLSAMAQTKQKPTLDDLMWGGTNYWNLQPRQPYTAWWGDALVQTNVKEVSLLLTHKGKSVRPSQQTLFDLQAVNTAIDTTRFGKIYNLIGTTFPEGNKTIAKITTPKGIIAYDWKKKTVVWSLPLEQGIAHEDFCIASRSLAFTKDYNLFVTTPDGRTHQVSSDGNRELLYGTSVHRDEFGIHKGTFWSPKGDQLAFYRMDQSMVTDYPQVNTLVSPEVRVAQPDPDKYPMAGMAMHKVTVGIFSPATDRTVWLQLGDVTDRYFTNLSWSPDGKTLYIMEVPRSQKRCDLVAYDATTGQRLKTLYAETNERFVEPQNPLTFLPWDDHKFIYQSERDGFNHLYLFDTNGKMLRQLTQGKFEVLEFLGFNTAKRSIILRTNESGHIRENLYAVDFNTGRRTLLDNGKGDRH